MIRSESSATWLAAITALMATGQCLAEPLAEILAANPELAAIAENPKYEVEICYTQIDRDADGEPNFRTYTAGSSEGRYFYPASTVKFPAALIAVEKLRGFGIEGLEFDTRMEVGADPKHPWQTAADLEPDAPTGGATLGGYLRKIFLYSSNDAYNRVFEFAGADALNKGLTEKGYEGVRLTYRLSAGSAPWHGQHSNPVTFRDGEHVLLELPGERSADYSAKEAILRGVAEWKRGNLIERPKDFSVHNALPLQAGQEMLKALVFPDAVPESKRFAITPEDRQFILRAMGEWPSESHWPKLDPEKYYDAYVKPLVLGCEPGAPPKNLRIFNKTGTAYGYTIDNAYIVDLENKVEFLLTARTYTNANGTFNDDVYEYDEIALPFFRDLGRAVLEHERKRPRKHTPDLGEFDLSR